MKLSLFTMSNMRESWASGYMIAKAEGGGVIEKKYADKRAREFMDKIWTQWIGE